MVSAIIFDLDNTLTHRNESIAAFCRKFVSDFKFKFTEPPASEFLYRLICSVDNNGRGKKSNPHTTIKQSIAEIIVAELPWLKKPKVEEILKYWVTEFPNCSVPMHGAKEVLDYLQAKGYRLALLSNGAQKTRLATLSALGFQHYFELIVASDVVGAKKPHPAAFTYLTNLLSIAPEDCCYVGDNLINDYWAAVHSGMKAYWLSDLDMVLDECKLPYVINQLSDLKSYF